LSASDRLVVIFENIGLARVEMLTVRLRNNPIAWFYKRNLTLVNRVNVRQQILLLMARARSRNKLPRLPLFRINNSQLTAKLAHLGTKSSAHWLAPPMRVRPNHTKPFTAPLSNRVVVKFVPGKSFATFRTAFALRRGSTAFVLFIAHFASLRSRRLKSSSAP